MKKNALLGSTLLILTSCLVYLVWLEKSTATKPQDPKLPYPYRSQEVRFQNNQAGINLSGTLTLPAKAEKVPAVILITGSGPQDRNGAVFRTQTLSGYRGLSHPPRVRGFALRRQGDRSINWKFYDGYFARLRG